MEERTIIGKWENEPQSANERTNEPQSANGRTNELQSANGRTNKPQSANRRTNEPQSANGRTNHNRQMRERTTIGKWENELGPPHQIQTFPPLEPSLSSRKNVVSRKVTVIQIERPEFEIRDTPWVFKSMTHTLRRRTPHDVYVTSHFLSTCLVSRRRTICYTSTSLFLRRRIIPHDVYVTLHFLSS